MDVVIEIHYIANGTSITQGASTLSKGRTKEQLGLMFLKWVRRKNSHVIQIEQITANKEDITKKVLEIERQDELKAYYAAEDLPF